MGGSAVFGAAEAPLPGFRWHVGPPLKQRSSQAFGDRCAAHGIALRFIQPGKPHQNTFIERFNRTYRYGVLDAYVFDSLQHVRLISEGWMRLYNEERPHRALDRLPPVRFAERLASPEISSFQYLLDGEDYPGTRNEGSGGSG